MSGGQSCKCNERKEPIDAPAGSNRPGRLWRVTQYKCNHSRFNGGHYTSSAYSACYCMRCGHHWRTKAPYADKLSALENLDDLNLSTGCPSHEAAMRARGREPYSRAEEAEA